MRLAAWAIGVEKFKLRFLAVLIALIFLMAVTSVVDAAKDRDTSIEDINRDTAGGSGYSIFFTPASHLPPVLDDGDFEAATAVVVEQDDYFTENG